jgi:hypothetical protein
MEGEKQLRIFGVWPAPPNLASFSPMRGGVIGDWRGGYDDVDQPLLRLMGDCGCGGDFVEVHPSMNAPLAQVNCRLRN